LAKLDLAYCVVGGLALDLWDGVPARTHADLAFTILREHIKEFRSWLPEVLTNREQAKVTAYRVTRSDDNEDDGDGHD